MTFISAPYSDRAQRLLPVLFCATIFLSASLLFFVQPLFTKIVLPHIGGAPAVWTTAMLFFQTVLIGGYLYAHVLTKRFSVRTQMGVHLTLWVLALFFLPLAVRAGWTYDADGSAVVQTLLLFAAGVGLPFAVLSANAPLIQAWYARSGGPSADDPYFLYGASNLGSLIALLAFPLAAEPLFGATKIGQGWAIGFVALGGFLLMSGLMARRTAPTETATSDTASPAPTFKQVSYWALIAFVPSSLMLALTTKISTDIGSMPLVWVIPLALYLLSFVLVFTNRPLLGAGSLHLLFLAALGVLAAAFGNFFGMHVSLGVAVLLMLAFLVVAMFAHAKLYSLRPAAEHLTIFYVTMSVGGALGGLFNSVLAPNLFNQIHEGPITVAIASLLVLGGSKLGLPRSAKLGVIGVLVLYLVQMNGWTVSAAMENSGTALGMLALITALVLMTRAQPVSTVLVVLGVIAIGLSAMQSDTLLRDRSFFGTHMVYDQAPLRVYANGTTLHGSQTLDDLTAERPSPRSYYHRNAPMAQVLTSDAGQAAHSIGIVGLGVGALACYRKPGQDWHFYEIDKKVDDIARNPALFTYMSACAGDAPTHMGDARMVLDQQDGMTFDVLIIDAYSSDSVPVHLTTIEAIELYLDRLAPGGVLLFHISNRYYAIDRPLGRAAEHLGLSAAVQHYKGNLSLDPGDSPSVVAMMARTPDDLARFADTRWTGLGTDGGRVWTDDYANLLEILLP